MKLSKVVVSLCVWLASAASLPAQYAFKTVQYPGSTVSAAFGINDAGEVVGTWVGGEASSSGFLYLNGHYQAMIVDYGITPISLFDVSDFGFLVGTSGKSQLSGFSMSAPLTSSNQENVSIDTQLNYPGAFETRVTGINPLGTIEVGYYITSSGEEFGFKSVISQRAVVPFGPAGVQSTAQGVNDKGDVVGVVAGTKGFSYGYLYTPAGGFQKIAFPGAVATAAFGINDPGVIVGCYQGTNGPLDVNGFVLKAGVYTKVDVPGATETEVFGINANGVIAGFYTGPGGGNEKGFIGTPSTTASVLLDPPDVSEPFVLPSADFLRMAKGRAFTGR